MFPRTLARRVSFSQRALNLTSFIRFQATVSTSESKQISSESIPSRGPKADHEIRATEPAKKWTGYAKRNAESVPQRRTHSFQYNRKLHDIVGQVRKSVESIESASSAELSEAIDIFEEGAAYLREIQATEGIDENALFSLFQSVLAQLFDLVLAEDANLGKRSVESVLDMLVEQRIAHTYHFIAVQKRILENTLDPEAYLKALQLWVTFLDYSKQTSTAGPGRLIKRAFGVYDVRDYRFLDALKLAYFALISHSIRSGEEYDLATTVKILQVDDTLRIPPLYHVTLTLNRLRLSPVLESDIRAFKRKVSERDAKYMDPNGIHVARKIEQYIQMHNGNELRKLFADMKDASVLNLHAISEQTLDRMMHAYIEVGLFDDALAIFASMCTGLIEKPASASWELVLKALGHPSNIGGESKQVRKQAVEKVMATFNTMVASGVEVNAKVLGVFIGSLANLDRQDLVAKYLEEYKYVPVVHMTKNNILVGLALNKKIADAEAQMRKFLKENPTYNPSTSAMNTFLAHYVAEGNDKAVEGILDFMRLRGIEENIATATTVLSYYFKVYRERGMLPNVQEFLSEVIRDTSKWDQQMVATLIDGLVKDGVNMDAARGVFRYFCDTHRRFKHSGGMLTSMIKAEMDFGSVHTAEELFAWYVKNIRNETVMYNMMIRGLLMKHESLALRYYADLCVQRPFHVAPNFYTYYFLLEHFREKGDRTRIQWVLDELATAELSEYGRILPRIIQELSRDYEVSPELLAALSGSA